MGREETKQRWEYSHDIVKVNIGNWAAFEADVDLDNMRDAMKVQGQYGWDLVSAVQQGRSLLLLYKRPARN